MFSRWPMLRLLSPLDARTGGGAASIALVAAGLTGSRFVTEPAIWDCATLFGCW